MGALTPGETFGTIYNIGVDFNKTNKHTPPARLSRAQKSSVKKMNYYQNSIETGPL
jgi:hypothetical protein